MAKIVDIGRKPDVRRRAVATGTILLRPTTVRAIRDGGIEKGDVLASAEVAALHAMKGVWQVLPHCHPIPITAATVAFDLRADRVIATTSAPSRTRPRIPAIDGRMIPMPIPSAIVCGRSIRWDW